MAVRYMCSNCLHDINSIFALPPVSPVAICRNCGFRMLRSIGSIANAWAVFCAGCTFVLVWAILNLVNLLTCESAARFVGAAMGSAIVAAIVSIGGALGGYLIGTIVGLMSNAAWAAPVVRANHLYKAVAAASATQPPDPRLYDCLDIQPPSGPRVVTRRCWHCGHAFQCSTAAGTKIQCPQCNANLGLANPNDCD